MIYDINEDFNYHYEMMVVILSMVGLDPDLIDTYSLVDILDAQDESLSDLTINDETLYSENYEYGRYNFSKSNVKRIFYNYTLLKNRILNVQ